MFAVAVAALCLSAGCTMADLRASNGPHPGRDFVGDNSDQAGPAYFTQSTRTGSRYAHNWVRRPCFSLELSDRDWILQSATANYVLWRRGADVLKVYLADNREIGYAVSGMDPEGALRAFVGYELDFVRPKFEESRATPDEMDSNDHGIWAHWSWEGRSGRRAGVGKAKPADQLHHVSSLWLDPWVLSFDWATRDMTAPFARDGEMAEVLRSLAFHPECFEEMRTGETW